MDQQEIEALAFRVVSDMAASFSMALGHIGDRLGLFKTLARTGPVTSEQLASRTGLNERYVREWLRAMTAAEYIDYDPATHRFIVTPEQASVLADDDGPLSVGGARQFTTPTVLNTPKLMEAFLDYTNFLVDELLRAVPGLTQRLSRGIHVADVGCGWGASTVTMASAFPRSRFLGIEPDAGSVERARRLAAERRVHNVFWLAAPAHQLAPLPTHDLICAFDCVHDMVDPRATLHATLRAIHDALADDGVYLWSEPNASDNPLDNRHPAGNAFACVSPLHCLTVSLAQDGEGLGTVIGERGVRELAKDAGFSSVDKLPIANPFNQFFALRK